MMIYEKGKVLLNNDDDDHLTKVSLSLIHLFVDLFIRLFIYFLIDSFPN